MNDREQDRFEKMKSLLVEAIELTKKADSTDDEDLEEKYLNRAKALYSAYEKMKAEKDQASEDTGAEESLKALGVDDLTINEIYYLSRLLGVSMPRTASVLLSAGLNHTIKTAFQLPVESDAGDKLDFMQISGVSPEAIRKALSGLTPDEV